MSSYVDWIWPEIQTFLDDIRAAKDNPAVQRRLLMQRFTMARKNVDDAMERYEKERVVREPVRQNG